MMISLKNGKGAALRVYTEGNNVGEFNQDAFAPVERRSQLDVVCQPSPAASSDSKAGERIEMTV